MKHRIGIVSEWKLPAFTSKSLISKSIFYSSCQQIFALQTKHLKGKVPFKIWFSHSDQTWGRRYSIVSYKAVSWHEGRWSLLYSRYLEIVQARHTQFRFAHTNIHCFLLMFLYHLYLWQPKTLFTSEFCNHCLTLPDVCLLFAQFFMSKQNRWQRLFN